LSHKEIAYAPFQKGWGITITNPVTRQRVLVGIFLTKEEVTEDFQVRRTRGFNARIVRWSKKIYDKYNYVFDKTKFGKLCK
jgi:hypothetical protein